MSVHGFSTVGGVWDCNYSKFVFSDDLGKTWKETSLKFGERDSNFNMMALSGEPGEGNEEREAAFPWGPWSTPHAVAKAAQYPQLYGGFMTPSFLKDNGRTLYFIMSMFGSYNAFVMKAKLVTSE